MSLPEPDAPRNHFLAALPASELHRLLPYLEAVPLEPRILLQRAGEPISHVYFPLAGVVSLLTALREGEMVEVGMVGREAFVGLPVFLGAGASSHHYMVQVPGEALRMRANDFRARVLPGGVLSDLLLRYTHTLLTQVSQSVACNVRHALRQRLCKWLLMIHDRWDGDVFPMTHQFLAVMLGVRRAGVSEAARQLQQAGLIDYSRSRMTILDRGRMENVACECYSVNQRELRRLLE